MVKKSLVWLYSVTTYLLWAAVIVVTSCVLVMRYYVLPHAKDYREAIARHASMVAGQRITIGDIEAGWDGMHPYLDLYRVDLHDAQNRPVLHLGRVEASLSWLSLPLAEPRLGKLVIHQPNLVIRRTQDGEVFVAGISMKSTGQPDFPNWLLRQSSIVVSNATVVWQDDMRQAPPLSLNNLHLNFRTPPWESLLGHHSFGLRATPSSGASAPIDIRGNVWGKQVDELHEWRGTIYGRLEGTDISAWRAWVDYPFDMAEGFGAAQFWLDFNDGQASKITADVLLANVRTRISRDTPETLLQNLSGRLGWKRLQNGQEFHGERLRLATADGFSIKQGALRVDSLHKNGKEVLQGKVTLDEIELESFATFATNLPLGETLQNQLAGFAPKGRLEDTTFSWEGDHSAIRQYDLRSRFANLGISPSRGIPGFSNLSGELRATEKNGSLVVDSHGAMLNLQDILRWPIPADRLTGSVNWQIGEGTTQVKIDRLTIASPHISGALDASYRYDGIKSGYLDLVGRFENANGRFAKFYYPLVLDKETLNWLDTSIFEGRGENVHVVIKGYLDDFPYADTKTGEFKVSARINNALLDYATGWPVINGVGLDMLFQGNRMDLAIDQGRVYGAQVTKARVSIPDLDAEHPMLLIQGEIQAPAADAVRFVNNSPILKAIDHFTDGLNASGKGKVQLDIQMPTDNPDIARVKGSYSISNGTLTGGENFPALDHIEGRLEFTEASLRARDIRANVYGGAARFSLESGGSGMLKLTANGRIGENGLRQAFDHPLMQRIHGATDWDAEISVRDHLADILVKSQLLGLSVSLPPPFSKSALDSVPLHVEQRQTGQQQQTLDVAYGNVVDAKLLLAGGVVDRGELSFGGTASIPAQRGLFINGKLAYLDWDLWRELLDKSPQAANRTGKEPEIAGTALDIGVLDIFGRRINNLTLNAKPVANGWIANLQSREITGDAHWQDQGSGKFLARLKSLTFPGPAPAKMSSPDEPGKSQEYPALDIVAENFEVKERKLGRLELTATPQGSDWSIDRINISNPDSTVNLSGKWHNWKSRPSTDLSLNWEIEDLGKTLDRFGYPGTVKAGTASLSGQLNWPGGPGDFSPAALNGTLLLDAKRGQFLKIQPGVGRLLGVLSLQALPRRLLFDFRDLFNDGFAFDSIGGNIRIDRGIMQSRDFRMEGPAAKVAISGKTNLERETLDLHVKVTPSLSDTLSIAALAGGPVAGAAAFVAQKLLRDPLNKIAAYEYDIGGTWDDPQELKPNAEKKEVPAQNLLVK